METNKKQKWLEEGFTILSEEGAGSLTIETLTGRLKVTKGAFYHHFKNWQDYKESLLSLYENERTLKTIEFAEQQLSPLDKFEYVMEKSIRRDQKLEVAVRAWALIEPFVQSYQQRIDQRRVDYLEEMIFLLYKDRERARTAALIFYSLHVGSQHLLPPVKEQDLVKLYRELQQAFHILA
ncbi:TetR/AcrR family transcriptional regulator [Paenibacillus flagellatus]|uniref:TetR/AcrR family transcriptional regulator n=1 Tax=Paenibacillus flagellatus TaxID=2211139 RepID=A0A2V5KXT3_9BACL|nr:TetR/AcrR family transcriptional regulator [Paenibacillus flagellatus]PYI57327.1 TetR/AcrR family transcriptional regulator [Paenibacillus flagellatus]